MQVKKKDVWEIVKLVFPDYTGRKFHLTIGNQITFWNTNWDGGTRTIYGAVTLKGGKSRVWIHMPCPWQNPIEGQTFDLLPGVAVVERQWFCGKDAGIHITFHPSTALPHKLIALQKAEVGN
jgi:hypothetical protein